METDDTQAVAGASTSAEVSPDATHTSVPAIDSQAQLSAIVAQLKGGTQPSAITVRTFLIDPDAESLLLRYRGYIEGREPLLAMAYFCLTVVGSIAGGRAVAAVIYAVDVLVLKKIGELTSQRGDRSTARKVSTGPAQPLVGNEGAWLSEVVKALIWRVGETRPASSLTTLVLSDLPPL